jgi:hypothetical protein
VRGKRAAGFGIVLFILVAYLEGAEAQQPWKGKIYKEGDVTIVKNPKDPIHKDLVLSIKEDFSIGGAGATGAYMFSDLRDIAVDQDGNIYALDLRDCCIKVFDRTAKHVRTIGRRGQGPGELGGPFSMTLLPSKGEIFVHDVSNRRITVFNTSGAYSRQIPVRGNAFQVKVDTSENIWAWITDFGQSVRSDVLKKMNPDMSQAIADIIRHPTDESRNPFKPRDCWILDDRDHLIYGDGNTYEIKIVDSSGRVLKKISREYDPVEATQAEKDDLTERTRKVLGSESAATIEFSSRHTAYRSFIPADGGRLLVQTWERSADGKQDIHDVFDAEGRFIGRVALNRHADFLNPKPRFIRDGKLYAIEPDKDGFEVIKRYSVEWKDKEKDKP